MPIKTWTQGKNGFKKKKHLLIITEVKCTGIYCGKDGGTIIKLFSVIVCYNKVGKSFISVGSQWQKTKLPPISIRTAIDKH